MAQVSRYPISEKVYQRVLKIFFKVLVKIKTTSEAEEFIKDFLSPTEQIMLAKRLAIAFLLEKDYDYRTISKILRVSFPTIASVNLMRKYGGRGYKLVVGKLMREEKIKDSLLEMAKEVSKGLGQSRKGGEVWRYLYHEIKKKKKEKPF